MSEATRPNAFMEAFIGQQERLSEALLSEMSQADWDAGRGCAEHSRRRSGSCHECAMLQPAPAGAPE